MRAIKANSTIFSAQHPPALFEEYLPIESDNTYALGS